MRSNIWILSAVIFASACGQTPETGELFVILFGTGLRGRSGLANMSVVLGFGDRTVRLPVEYAGPREKLPASIN